ncbi:FHA domain-containing protein [Streptomyces sp. NPDC054933]|jgi:hypothetical protein
MPTCPNGHQSQSDDWCEVCGLRMSAPATGPGVPAPPPPPPSARSTAALDPDATVAAEPCPSCGTLREGQAAFCEECRYNFLSHTVSSFPPPPPAAPYARLNYPPPYERTSSRPSQMNRPAEPLSPDATVAGETEGGGDGGDFLLSPPSGGGRSTSEASAASEPPVRHEESEGPGSAATESADPATANWTAIVAADREYFTAMMARSESDGAGLYFPTYSPEQYVPLTSAQVTVGRRRHSTGEAPDIDLSRPPEDPGVSHKHAVLVRKPDGGWSVIDQDSTNGTTVNGGADPIAPFQPVDLADGDRVHVGAWTTITLRRG